MPIRRTYACPECNHMWGVVLSMDQSDDPPPSCPACDARETYQDFKPIATVNSSPHARAQALAEDIMANDYHVADIDRDRRREAIPKVRYKDETPNVRPSTWGGGAPAGVSINANASLETAIAMGREIRQKFGSGLDVLQSNLKSGAQQDLIAISKKRSAKIW